MNEIEAEMIIESKLSAIQSQENISEEESDVFLISNKELILRTIKKVCGYCYVKIKTLKLVVNLSVALIT